METQFPHAPSIADHGLIGNCRTAALVSSRGEITWMCAPHFDSPFLFARLLDHARGGSWELQPTEAFRSNHEYMPGTNVLVTTYTCDGGRVRTLDLMDVTPESGSTEPRPGALFRIVQCLEGTVRMRSRCMPRPGNGVIGPVFNLHGNDAHFGAFRCTAPGPWEVDAQAHAIDHWMTMSAGERCAYALSGPGMESAVDAFDALDGTLAYWHDWSARCTYIGPYRTAVVRSVLTLKLLHDQDTGAIAAAPTTSLPEEIGGVRNWDYRFCWIRDASFTLNALMQAGYLEEEEALFKWIFRTVKLEGPELHVLYPLSREGSVEEIELDHLEGYRRSKPVRVGNAAARQLQLDVFGEVLDAIHFACTKGLQDPRPLWQHVLPLIDWVLEHWQLPENGIWEVRGGRRHFVFGKVMCWVALDRAIQLAERYRLPGDVDHWKDHRSRIKNDVLHHGWSDKLQAFMQSYEDERLDAANLMLPILGFIDGADPRMIATIEATNTRLVDNGLCYRYLDAPDGVEGGEATFVLCSFWLIEALILANRMDEARNLFERMLARATPLGLYAEELDAVTGEHLGNFPQALSHIGLINAAVALDRQRPPA
ncbi:MAG: glycoside hydrolase family 15 protein [Flavobacteriales bacterium]|nr:glycoside hydrolase family 15 protein [Flavobacteriales bacterium]